MLVQISYKTKLKQNSKGRKFVMFKKNPTRCDCSKNAARHSLYNSELFVLALNRSVNKVQEGMECCFVDELPAAIVINEGKFMSDVTMTVDM